MSIATTPRGYVERPRPSGLADVVDVILDKGIVIDAYVRVALIGIEILTPGSSSPASIRTFASLRPSTVSTSGRTTRRGSPS